MKAFPKGIKFKYPWRVYQQRVLDDLNKHLDDDHLHVVAPPGSGKTVLGLEVALRLNKPTLIFAPTTAIRNQWINRFCELFLGTSTVPDWISTSVKEPKFLTVSTYQGLFAALQEKEEKSNATQILKKLKAQKIKTIVLDEAHHLKNAWWKALMHIKQELKPTIVGLTATPPYDVSFAEWDRYMKLNGSVDEEITIPELMIEGELCPHQDFVYLTTPSKEETEKLFSYRNRIKELFAKLGEDTELKGALKCHMSFLQPEENLSWIYKNVEVFCSILIYLKHTGESISKEHMEILGGEDLKLPRLENRWYEVLLSYYLFAEKECITCDDHKVRLTRLLKRYGTLERRSVNFTANSHTNKYLNASTSKLNGISTLVNFEKEKLQDKLSCVILTDYIRKEYYTQSTSNTLPLTKIGVMSIFELLRREGTSKKLSVLTGSIVIIPKKALKRFEELKKASQIESISYFPLKYDDDYLKINRSDKNRHLIVQIVTHLFEEDDIDIIIGTKSLLGEGWDAPSINALILASNIGSFVSSNQMRGRAIRLSPEHKGKTGHIWHLACIDPTSDDGGSDLETVIKRFKAFVGISYDGSKIANGIARLEILDAFTMEALTETNKKTFEYASDRDKLKELWQKALASGNHLVEQIKIPFPVEQGTIQGIRNLYYSKTSKNLFGFLGSSLLTFAYSFPEFLLRRIRNIKSIDDILRSLTIFGAIGIVTFASLMYKSLTIYISYRDITKDVKKISEALLQSLIHVGKIKTDPSLLEVTTELDKYGCIYCNFSGGTNLEKSRFMRSMEEILDVVNNPRYIIVRKSYFAKMFKQRDYHSVPSLLSQKEDALFFGNKWYLLVGQKVLVDTRTIDGRRVLIKARMKSLAAQLTHPAERVSIWK